MQLNAKLASYDIQSLETALREDLAAKRLTVAEGKFGWTATLTGETSLQRRIEELLNNAFKQGCKAGKGGFDPGY
jgi:hypothetical protein